MRKIIYTPALILASLISFFSCDSSGTKSLAPAVGAPYELLVVCAQDKWSGEVGDTIQAIMGAPVEMINQREPLYTINRILPNSFSGLLQKSRNVLNIVTGSQYEEPRMTAQYDIYSAPQLIVTVSGPGDREITDYMSEHREEMAAVFEIAERNRDLSVNARYGEKRIEEEILEKFNFKMNLGKGYTVRNKEKDFMWISMEYPTASQGVVIYRYPYSGKENFTVDSLLARRNQFVSFIPGENPGSHMTTLDDFVPVLKQLRVNGRYWAEIRGFWDVKNDYMGGPFVSYSTLDTENEMVVALDFYVYSPDKPKRNFIRQLEHLIYSVSFKGDEEAK